jgi:oligopeptide/dipeptide ABC transporter ATP-binding protein
MLRVTDLHVRFGSAHAVAGVDLAVGGDGQTVGLVGESGSGKTTIVRAILQLVPHSEGRIDYDGTEIGRLKGSALRGYRRRVQLVPQDADGSLSPRMKIGTAIGEVLQTHRLASRNETPARVDALLSDVGLSVEMARRLPHQLSGGQRQRVVIARALAVSPRLLILDEPTSALDVTVQDQVLTLLERMRAEHELSFLFISHNLAVVERMCDSIFVLYHGRVVETGSTAAVLSQPGHPYTIALRSAVPQLTTERRSRLVLHGSPPDPANPPPGCVFHPRCPLAIEQCRIEVPELVEILEGRRVACHRAPEVLAGALAGERTAPATIQEGR